MKKTMTRMEYLRRKRGLSQDAVGEEIHYSRGTISQIENGRIPNLDRRGGKRLRLALESFFCQPFEQLIGPA